MSEKKQAVPAFLSAKTQVIEQENHYNAQLFQRERKDTQDINAVLKREFIAACKEVEVIKSKIASGQPPSSTMLEKLEAITKDSRFIENESVRKLANYLVIWVEYAGMVRDAKCVYEYMQARGIGQMEPNFYVSYALYYEKYERNFTKAEEIYRQGILMTKNAPQAQEVILQKFKDFGSRMVRRIERDITPSIDPKDRAYQDQITSKKRKFAEAFPKGELNSSGDSQSSDQSGPTQSKKKRLLNQIIELGENVMQYEESIHYLKQTNPDFQDIKVHDELVKELQAKPLSWLSKQQQQMNSLKTRIVNSNSNEDRKTNQTPPKSSLKDAMQAHTNQSQLQVPLTNMSQRLDIIGEASLEMGSSLANQSSFQSKNIIHDSVASQNAYDENQNEFKTANNSIQEIGKKAEAAKIETDLKLEKIQNQLNQMWVKYQSGGFHAAQVQPEITKQFFSDFFNIMSILNGQSGYPQPVPQVSNFMNPRPSQINIQQTQTVEQHVPHTLIQIPQSKETHGPKRFSGILMDLISQNDEPSSGPHQSFPQTNFVTQTPATTMPSQNVVKDYYNTNLINNNAGGGAFGQSINIQRRSSSANSFGLPGLPPRNNNNVSYNESFMDASPIEEAQNKFKGFHINPNYSRDQFNRKKTISKSKEALQNHSPFGMLMKEENSEDSGLINSPFGVISPLNNQTYKVRQSNVMRDCSGETLAMMIQNSNNQPRNPTPLTYPQRQPFGIMHPNTSSMQYQSYNPTVTAKPSTRDSVDSSDFKDCINHNENVNIQSYSAAQPNQHHRRVPSALKNNSNNSIENGSYEANSRHASKSVRFESN